jgi:CheY-like chemotaxis protein
MAFILLVEHNREVLGILAEILKSADHDVIEATNGIAALDIVQSGRPLDLIVTDLVTPGLDGFELARRSLAQRPNLRVLYLTGGGHIAPEPSCPRAVASRPNRQQLAAEFLAAIDQLPSCSIIELARAQGDRGPGVVRAVGRGEPGPERRARRRRPSVHRRRPNAG